MTLGLHKKGSTYDVLTADDCQLVHEDMTKILTCVHEYFLKRNVSYYKRCSIQREPVPSASPPRCDYRRDSDHVITTSQEEHDLESLKEELLALQGG